MDKINYLLYDDLLLFIFTQFDDLDSLISCSKVNNRLKNLSTLNEPIIKKQFNRGYIYTRYLLDLTSLDDMKKENLIYSLSGNNMNGAWVNDSNYYEIYHDRIRLKYVSWLDINMVFTNILSGEYYVILHYSTPPYGGSDFKFEVSVDTEENTKIIEKNWVPLKRSNRFFKMKFNESFIINNDGKVKVRFSDIRGNWKSGFEWLNIELLRVPDFVICSSAIKN